MPTATSIVGALACQRNSFLKTFETIVVSCNPYKPILSSKDKQNKNLKKSEEASDKLFGLELQDTNLFPEGGGQPYDTGSIYLPDKTKVDVLKVLRDGLKAVHVIPTHIEPGTKVSLNVDWERRVDIMQQHTGQHLISAIFDTFNLETLSWSMGEEINYIELPEKVDEAKVSEANRLINEKIFENLPIKVVTPDEHGGEIDTSNIPADYDLSKGVVRVVTIDGLDTNPCCGTHLQSTGQIQAVSLLHQTNIRGGHSRLHFVCGSRVYKTLAAEHRILKEVSGSQLSCQIEEVVTKVADLNTNYRKTQSRESNFMKELAAIEAGQVYEKLGATDVACVYREDASGDYLNVCQKEILTLMNKNKESGINFTNKTVVFIHGDPKSAAGGMVKISGPKAEGISGELKKILTNLKGGGKGASYQGKVTKYEKGELSKAVEYLRGL